MDSPTKLEEARQHLLIAFEKSGGSDLLNDKPELDPILEMLSELTPDQLERLMQKREAAAKDIVALYKKHFGKKKNKIA